MAFGDLGAVLPSSFIPSGGDWADGLNGHPGTVTPDSAIIVHQSPFAFPGVVFEEYPDSPEIERAEQVTIKHRFKGDYATMVYYINHLHRGVMMVDDVGNYSRILSATIVRTKPKMADLIVIAEQMFSDSPPDRFSFEIIELNPALEKHPRYAALPADIRNLVNANVSAAQIVSQQETQNRLSFLKNLDPTLLPANWNSVGLTWRDLQECATELLQKRRIGEDTFYLPGFRVVWTQYFWKPQYVDCGGYIQDPITQGGLPPYFWNPRWPDDPSDTSDNVFSKYALINPQLYTNTQNGSTQISWLRQADTYDFDRTIFRLTKIWIGAPYAHWDAQIYTNSPSPYPPPPPFTTS